MTTKLYDNSGYELSFEEEIPESEKAHYLTVYPVVDLVAERRIHCTSCNSHIGTAPNAEARIRMHPVLKVTHCRSCHSFYNSGEFDKGEDGSELYCRWCGQGGEVYCCSSCPYVFCKKCITQNFSRSMITDIEKQDNWECFSCSPQILFNLRAQHWALTNFIEKQTKDITGIAANLSQEEITERMAKDSTTCCRRKSEVVKKPVPAPKKRAASPARGPPPKKAPERVFRASTLLGGGTSAPQLAATRPATGQSGRSSSNLVCAPDILSMFSDDAPDVLPTLPTAPTPRVTISSAPMQRVRTDAVPPLAIRQYGTPQRPQIRPAYAHQQPSSNIPMVQISQGTRPVGFQRQTQAAGGAPVYHTIHGFRIDLNTAATQDTFRLPNGKLIQVKKQAPHNTPPSNVPRPQVIQRNVVGQVHNNMGIRYQQPQIQMQPPTRVINGGYQVQMQQPNVQQLQQQIRTPSTGLSLQPPAMTLEKPCHPPTPLGIARNAFEFKVLNTLEVCHQIIGKINTLTNYPSYKTVNHITELKDLYKHLSYLLSYTVSRFKGLQDKCAQESKALGFDETETEKAKNAGDDELEVIEQQAHVIDLDSDAEEEGELPAKTPTPPRAAPPPRPSTSTAPELRPSMDISSIIEKIGDPKLKMIPRVDIMRAETLIPSVEQLLKKERKDSTDSLEHLVTLIEIPDPTQQQQQQQQDNDSDDEALTTLLEVTPDISVMASADNDADDKQEDESDGDSVIELIDSPEPTQENMVPKAVMKISSVESGADGSFSSKSDDDDVVLIPDMEDDAAEKTTEPKDIAAETHDESAKEDDVIMISSLVTNESITDESTTDISATVEGDKDATETDKNESKEDDEGKKDDKGEKETSDEPKVDTVDAATTSEEAPKDSETKDDTESTKEVVEEPMETSTTNDDPEKEPEQETAKTDTPVPDVDENKEVDDPKSSKELENQSEDIEMTEPPVTENGSGPNPVNNPEESLTTDDLENDIEMGEVPKDVSDSENVQSNSSDKIGSLTSEKCEEGQLTLQDVELLGDDDIPDKELGTLSKAGEDLSIEDFNLGESELNDLAENLVQEGWDKLI